MVRRTGRGTGGLFCLFCLLLLVACSPDQTQPAATAAAPTATDAPATAVAAATATSAPAAPATPQPTLETVGGKPILTSDTRSQRLQGITDDWNTNWNRHTISYDELLSGGPPRDGIPSIDNPRFVNPEAAATWLADNEPVMVLEIDGDGRAYPLQIITWHEIVNDTVGGVPVVVTFCPLCNSALAFDRRFDGEVYEFGVSGLLRNSDLVMYDRTTESLWQQLTGEAIVGDLAGEQLTFLPSRLVSFDDFRAAYPDGQVLSRDTGFERPYGRNPYAGYDTYNNTLSAGGDFALFRQELDERLEAAERVVTVSLPEEGLDVAYPLTILAEQGVINDTQGSQDLVIFYVPGTASALDAEVIAESRDVGATGVYDPHLNGRKLTFRQDGGQIVDVETGSTWNIFGQATAGPLAGEQLEPLVHGDHFWFSWAAFKPETIIYQGP